MSIPNRKSTPGPSPQSPPVKRYVTEEPATVVPPNDSMIRLLAAALIKEYRIQLPNSQNAITELTDSDGSQIYICCHWKRKAVEVS